MDFGGTKRKNYAQASGLAVAEKEKPHNISFGEVLKEFVKRFEGAKKTEKSSNAQVLSADRIMKLARAKLHLLKSENAHPISIMVGNSEVLSDLPPEVSEDLELAVLVQASAEMVASGKFASARRLLLLCDDESLAEGSPVQRTVFYFARALKERIEQELQKAPSGIDGKDRKPVDVVQTLSLEPPYMAAQQECPFPLTNGCAAVQSILDTVTTQKKIHLIDFGINNGAHWTTLMQDLANRSECPLELLKITAVGMFEEMMKEIGNRLSCFAESLNITSFSFKIVLSDLKDLKEDLFELEADEAVVVYVALTTYTLSSRPLQLEVVSRLIQNIRPCLILVREVAANTNLPDFTEQFNEALLFFSASFDCIKVCMRNQVWRKMYEENFLGKMIRDVIVTHDGSDHERFEGWKALFGRHDIVETELSPSSLFHASLMLKSFAHWSCCSLEMDKKCLILSWNETPMFSLSAWKPLCQ